MALLEVLQYPDERLHIKAKPIERVDEEILKLVEDMKETMYHYDGIGLAATQVNVHKRLFIMDLYYHDRERDLKVFVNPEIIQKEGQVIGKEGCLSVTGIVEQVLRSEKIVLRYLDLNNQVQEINCEGLMAVCVQHEIDHLNGIVFVDRLSHLKQKFVLKKLKKIYKPV